jgi:hypothetical protein
MVVDAQQSWAEFLDRAYKSVGNRQLRGADQVAQKCHANLIGCMRTNATSQLHVRHRILAFEHFQ